MEWLFFFNRYVAMVWSGRVWRGRIRWNGWLDLESSLTHLLTVPTLYFWFSKVLVESSPTSFFLFSPTKSAATWAGRTFSSRSLVRFSHSSISSLSVRFLFFSKKSWRQQNSSCEEDEELEYGRLHISAVVKKIRIMKMFFSVVQDHFGPMGWTAAGVKNEFKNEKMT